MTAATMSIAIVDLTESSPPPFEQARMPSPQALLFSAIDSAQPARLRETLRALCISSTDTARMASGLLIVEEGKVKHNAPRGEGSEEEDDEDDSDDDSDDEEEEQEDGDESGEDEIVATTKHSKRSRPRYATCKRCSEEFDVTDNGKQSCVYHPGMLKDRQ